eukprot:1698285-Prymnesium_polylepis.1
MRTEQRNLGARQQQGPVGGELAIPVHSYGAFAIAIISTNALAAASANVASLMFAATRRTTRDGVCTTSLVSSSNSASIASAARHVVARGGAWRARDAHTRPRPPAVG